MHIKERTKTKQTKTNKVTLAKYMIITTVLQYYRCTSNINNIHTNRSRRGKAGEGVYTIPSLLPISDHNIVTAHVKLLGHFARNRRVREAKGPPPIDRRRLMTDPHLRQQVATAIGDHLRAFPPSGSSVDDVETAFTTAILQTAEQVAPPRATRLPCGVGGETPRQKQRSA